MVARSQLREAGLGAKAIEYRLAAGRLHPLHRGVYALGHPRVTAHGHWMAAVLAAGPGAVLSHRSAAALWGMRPSGSGIVEVSVPTRSGRRPRAGLRVRRVTVSADDLTEREGIAVTTPARTLLDLAEVVPRRALERALDEAEYLRLFDLSALFAAVGGNTGRRGAGILKSVLETHGAGTTLTRSELEESFLALCRTSGIPRPKVNARLGRLTVDFLWPDHRLVVETDGHTSHATRRAFERDRARDARLTVAGYRVVRFTYRQVTREANAVAASLRALLTPSPPPAPRSPA